LRG
ncbi:hypothetical protein D050_4876B, partial [Vibrio parahaemolyticus VPCR-2009]|jgi:hypothetical protein